MHKRGARLEQIDWSNVDPDEIDSEEFLPEPTIRRARRIQRDEDDRKRKQPKRRNAQRDER